MLQQLFAPPSLSVAKLQSGVCHNKYLIQRLIDQWHSTLPAPVGWRVAFILSDGFHILGASTWGRPVARLEDQETTLEHTRMALSPDAPRNSATWFIAQNRKWIREHMPSITRLIAYVNGTVHTGVTYRGDNWRTIKREHNTSSWTNRPGRLGDETEIRIKFEREP